MNNCPKCGNPLQPGSTNCPVCGMVFQETASNQKTVASVSSPVTQQNPEPQPVVVTVNENQSVPPTQTITNKPVLVKTTEIKEPVEPVQPVSNDPKPQQPVEPQVQVQPQAQTPQVVEVSQPVQPVEPQVQAQPQVQTPQVVETSQPVQPVVTQVQAQPQVQTPQVVEVSQPVQPVVPQVQAQPQPVQVAQQPAPVTNVAPVGSFIQNTENGPVEPQVKVVTQNTEPVTQKEETEISPIPEYNSAATVVSNQQNVKEKNKKPLNKKIILCALIIIIAGIGVGCFLLFGNTGEAPLPPKEEISALTGIVTSNGYKFQITDGWIVTEGNSNVIITNSSDSENTVQMKLSHSTANIDNINEDVIKKYLNNNEKIVDSKIEKTEISTKQAYILNAKVTELPVQVYFIGGGSRLLIGATVIYSSDSAVEKYEKEVQEIISTISYSDDSVKAFDIMDMYSTIFQIYNGIVTYSEMPTSVQEIPMEEEQPTPTPENENPSTPENENQPTEQGEE